MSTRRDLAPDPATAVARAEAEALREHEAGTCHMSEWSCSWCEPARIKRARERMIGR